MASLPTKKNASHDNIKLNEIRTRTIEHIKNHKIKYTCLAIISAGAIAWGIVIALTSFVDNTASISIQNQKSAILGTNLIQFSAIPAKG